MKKIKYLILLVAGMSCVLLPQTAYAQTEEGTGGETPLKYTVTFESDGGIAVASQQVESGKSAARPTAPTKTGFTFKGWFLDAKEYDFTTAITKDITLKASWEEVKTPTSSYLSNLKVDRLDFDQAFGRTNENYTITVPSDTKTITIVATADDNSVIFSGTGKKDLVDGKNVFKVITKLKATNDKEKTYTITVTREKPDVTLESLKVTGFALKEAFQKDVTQYTMEVPYDTKEINVIAKASNSNASVAVTGAKDFVVGENKVIVTVTYATGTKQEYVILVTRLAEETEEQPITSAITSEEKDPTPIVPTSKTKDNTLKYVFIVVGSFLALVLAGLGIFFYLKTTNKKKKSKKESPVIPEGTVVEDAPLKVEEVEAELEQTKEAPVVDHSDILDGIDDLLDSEEK